MSCPGPPTVLCLWQLLECHSASEAERLLRQPQASLLLVFPQDAV